MVRSAGTARGEVWGGCALPHVVVRTMPPFLPRDASEERGYEIACRLSVCLSVTYRYRDHIGWNTSKIISRPNSLRPMRSLMPNTGDLVQREQPKIRVE